MVDVVLYTRLGCPYCTLAKQLIQKKAVKFKEVNIWEDARFKNEMIKRSGGASTVPQVFIDGDHIGGCDDLYALDRAGHLDSLLK